MTREIQQSFREILNMTTWIDMDTKRLATEKVDAMTLRIGYPDSILNREQLDERYKDVSKGIFRCFIFIFLELVPLQPTLFP